MKPSTPGPTLAAYGDPTSPRLVVWYAGTDQDARMEGGACPAYLAAFLAAGCFVVRVAPTVEGEDGRQWTEETADAAKLSACRLWRSDEIGKMKSYIVGFSNGTTGACWAAEDFADGLALLCGSGLTQPVDPSVPVYLGFGSRDRKVSAATAAARVDAWQDRSRTVTWNYFDHRHEVHEAHLPAVLATFGLVTP